MKYTVGALLADCLAANGVDTVFGIVSVHNMAIMDAIAARPALRMVMTRGETGAAHMADGHARARQGLGVVITSTGPGATNAVPGLAEAQFAGSPVLHITGQTATPYLGSRRGTVHDMPSQHDMLRSVGKAVLRVTDADSALAVIQEAIRVCLQAPAGPVSLEIPVDLQGREVAMPDPASLKVSPAAAPPAEPAVIAELLRRIKAARRPMLWVGAGAKGAASQLAALVDLGFGVVSSWSGRGVVDDHHPRNLGALNGAGSPAVLDLYRSADLMLVVGSRLRGQETDNQAVPLPAPLLRVDIDAARDSLGYANELFVQGDCAEVLDRLLAGLADGLDIDPAFDADVRAARQAAIDDYLGRLGPYRDFPAMLRRVLPDDALWVRDITKSNSTWGHRLFPLRKAHQNIYPVSAGIGQGLQLGIGAALASPGRKTAVLTGDGGFYFNMTELWTAVQERLDMLVIVMNDQGYGAIRGIQDVVCDGRHRYDALGGPSFADIAQLAGAKFWKVEAAQDFERIAAEAYASPGLCVVEVDMVAIGALPMYYPYIKAGTPRQDK